MPGKPTLLACPRCGRLPRLHSDFVYAWERERGADGRHSLVVNWFECRRRFGLLTCFRGPLNYIEKGWGDLGMRGATWKWNDVVRSELMPSDRRGIPAGP